jgi:predicted phage-related endonuclease
VEVETIKKTQMEANLEVEKSIIDRIQEIEERISGVEDAVKEVETTVKENSKHKKLLTQSIQEI